MRGVARVRANVDVGGRRDDGGDAAFAAKRPGRDARDEAFPHAHVVEYVVCVDGEMLTTTMRVTNEGEDAFEFTTALHTYFRVGDCGGNRVEGLKSTSYLDSLDGRREKTDEMNAVEFHEEVDRFISTRLRC